MSEASPEEDIFNEDEFLLELDQTFGKKANGSAKKERKAITWNSAPIEIKWHPHAVELHCTSQRCDTCGSYAGGVDGLFAVDSTANGALRHQRIDAIPPSHSQLPRTVAERTQSVPFCPLCFEAAITLSTPDAEPFSDLNLGD